MPPLDIDISELAPAGFLRAAVNVANAALVQVDERTGMLVGPSIDLANSLAAEIGCELSINTYQSAGAILAAAEKGEWDIAFIAADPSRADSFEFSPAYACVTATFLVQANSHIVSAAEVDVPGYRISAARGAAYTKQLERQLNHAVIVHADGPSTAIDLLKAGSCDAAVGLRDFLELAAAQETRLRVLNDTVFEIPQTIAVRKGVKAAPFIADFVASYIKARN